jgi:FMN reductase
VENLLDASVLVVGSPTYKGSYTGLFKHFFDLLDPTALKESRSFSLLLAAASVIR